MPAHGRRSPLAPLDPRRPERLAPDCPSDRAVNRWLTEAIATLPGVEIETLRAVSEIRLDRAAAVFGQLLTIPQRMRT